VSNRMNGPQGCQRRWVTWELERRPPMPSLEALLLVSTSLPSTRIRPLLERPVALLLQVLHAQHGRHRHLSRLDVVGVALLRIDRNGAGASGAPMPDQR